MLLSKELATRVVIVGEDSVVGRILELLLCGVGYGASFVTAETFGAPGPAYREAQVLLLSTLGMSPERRDTFVSSVVGAPGLAGVPILELTSFSDHAQAGIKYLVPWPCPTEELKRRIEDALLDGARPEEKESRD